MLKYLKIRNFLSFKNETEISFVSDNRWSLKNNVFSVKNTILTKNLIIYGANASGKSNIIEALNFIDYFVRKDNMDQWVIPFSLDEKKKKEPSFFEIGFFIKNKEYQYSFEIHETTVISEKLVEIQRWGEKKKLFDRKKQNFNIHQDFRKEFSKWEGKIKENSSILSVLSRWNGKLNGEDINFFFEKIWLITVNSIWPRYTVEFMNLAENNDAREFMIKVMQHADINIEDIQIKKKIMDVEETTDDIKQAKKTLVSIIFWHKVAWSDKLEYFPSSFESDGTRQLFSLIWPIVDAIYNEKILFIDEIENKLHFLIVEELLKLINSNIKNKKYQIFCTTHNIELINLDILKKDQICFVEKDADQSTEFYKLSDIDLPIRKGLDIKKFYRHWSLWAIPYIQDFSYLVENYEEDNKQKTSQA